MELFNFFLAVCVVGVTNAASLPTSTHVNAESETSTSLVRGKRFIPHHPVYLTSPCGEGDSDISATLQPPSEGFPLPNIAATIASTSYSAVQVRDKVANRIGSYSTIQQLSAFHWPYVKKFGTSVSDVDAALQQPGTTIHDLWEHALRYSVYLQHIRLDEQAWLSYRPADIEEDLTNLIELDVRNLLCSTSQYADHAGVTLSQAALDSVHDITYTSPSSIMWTDYEAFVTLNSFHADYLSFALEFFNGYDAGAN